MRFINLILILLSIGLFSCEKTEDYLYIPEIKFVSLEQTNGQDDLGNEVSIVKVRFSFIDGDGDLGLSPSDTIGDFAPGKDFYYNLLFQYYEKKDGQFVQNESVINSFRFQNISKVQTANKALKGDMIAELIFSKSSEINYADTSKNTLFIYDRALNKSNIIETSEFYLNK